ncbi:MAG: NAD(+) diphosphatase [Sphingobium sp.]
MSDVLGFTGGRLDRVDHIRSDAAALGALFADDYALRLRLDGLDPVVEDGRLAMEPLPRGAAPEDHALLGVLDDGRPLFVGLETELRHAAAVSPRSWGVSALVEPEETALYGGARSLVDWHARHRFCAACGGGTQLEKAGWARKCDGCGAEHFPRVDPVVIMLAEHDGRVLVGRQPRFPAGNYSALAGFVEPGEAIEEAVARELKEEAGIAVRDVRYVMSQPWPFPSSLMMACLARADDDRLTLDLTELEDAIWCDAAGVRAALEGAPDAPFRAPPPIAIARHLLIHWLAMQP